MFFQVYLIRDVSVEENTENPLSNTKQTESSPRREMTETGIYLA